MDLKVRFIGRFCYVTEGVTSSNGTKTCRRLTTIAPQMDPQHRRGIAKHHPTLIIPHPLVDSGSSPPDLTFFSSDADVAKVTEYFIWNLDGCSLTVEGIVGSGFQFNDAQIAQFADLVGTPPTLNPQVFADPAKSAANTIVMVNSGSFMGVSFPDPLGGRGPRDYDYGPQSGPFGGSVHSLCDAVEAVLRVSDEDRAIFNIKPFGNDGLRSVRLKRSTEAAIISVADTCGNATEQRVDREFIAYYDLLDAPPEDSERRVPHLRPPARNDRSSTVDCTLQVVLTPGP